MKKINLLTVLTATLAAGFTACTNSEEIARVEQRPMDFSVFANKATRAAETTGTLNSAGKTFGVWGYSTINGAETTVFSNQAVTYNGTSSKWEYSPLKFWDIESSYKFYAYFPHQDTGGSPAFGVAIDGTAKTLTFTDFTVDHTNYTDLLVANEITRAAAANGNVDFTFNHILSNINLAFKKGTQIAASKLTLQSVKLYGMNNKGTFAQTASGAATGTWSTSEAVTLASATEFATTPAGDVVTATTTYADKLLIPQGTDALKLYVKYAIGDNEDQVFERTLALDKASIAANPDTWGQNQKITYNFTIDANVIAFDNPTITDWDAQNVSDIEIE